jgi:tRNA dimethylallyltransferase
LPVIVGGTGLYIDSLLADREFSARESDELRTELELEYESVGGEEMLRRLKEFDTERAEKLHANDKKRIIRALEIYKITGKTITQHDLETKSQAHRYNARKIALNYTDRLELYERIDLRVETMIINGLEREVRGLLEVGVSPDCTAMQAIGYKELLKVIIEGHSLQAAIEEIKQESRRLAKRQLTWLRRDGDIEWLNH